jgi:hypothetical protein
MPAARTPGQASGKVTRHMRLPKVAPAICAASSSAGSVARNTAAVMMKASGARLSPCTQPMPMTLAMLKTGPNPKFCWIQTFTSPMRGCIRKSQPIAEPKPGKSKPTAIKVKSSGLAGRSLRSTSQAMGTPKNSATSSVVTAKPIVLPRTR